MTTTSTDSRIFDTFALRDDYLGWGYIGERSRAIESINTGEWDATALAAIDAADAYILDTAAGRGWSTDRLFAWANSKDGRWFADCAIGCSDLATARRYL